MLTEHVGMLERRLLSLACELEECCDFLPFLHACRSPVFCRRHCRTSHHCVHRRELVFPLLRASVSQAPAPLPRALWARALARALAPRRPPHLYSALPSHHSRDSLPFIRECAYCFDSVDSPGGVLLSLSGGATVCARCLPTEAARASALGVAAPALWLRLRWRRVATTPSAAGAPPPSPSAPAASSGGGAGIGGGGPVSAAEERG